MPQIPGLSCTSLSALLTQQSRVDEPMALIASGSVIRLSTAGMESASSTQLKALSNTSGAVLRQCQILLQNHSDEYMLPHFGMYSGRCFAATCVIRAASS